MVSENKREQELKSIELLTDFISSYVVPEKKAKIFEFIKSLEHKHLSMKRRGRLHSILSSLSIREDKKIIFPTTAATKKTLGEFFKLNRFPEYFVVIDDNLSNKKYGLDRFHEIVFSDDPLICIFEPSKLAFYQREIMTAAQKDCRMFLYNDRTLKLTFS